MSNENLVSLIKLDKDFLKNMRKICQTKWSPLNWKPLELWRTQKWPFFTRRGSKSHEFDKSGKGSGLKRGRKERIEDQTSGSLAGALKRREEKITGWDRTIPLDFYFQLRQNGPKNRTARMMKISSLKALGKPTANNPMANYYTTFAAMEKMKVEKPS
jgi:hypothetical protein